MSEPLEDGFSGATNLLTSLENEQEPPPTVPTPEGIQGNTTPSNWHEDPYIPPAKTEATSPPQLTLSVLNKELKTLTKPIQFGVSLGIFQSVLETIKENDPSNLENRKIALFEFIAKNCNSVGITWSNIADALRDIDYGDLSSTVRGKYCTI